MVMAHGCPRCHSICCCDSTACTHRCPPSDFDRLMAQHPVEVLQAQLDLANEKNAALRKRVEELEISAGSAAMTIRLAQARAEKAERLLALSRDALLRYFQPGEVGEDVAPRIVEMQESLRERAEKAEAQLQEAELRYAREFATRVDFQERAEKAERERDEARALLMRQQDITIDAYKNLDAALNWIEHDEDESIPPAGLWQRVKALLEKRREKGEV